MNFELPDITNALELNNTLSSYVINLMREKSLSFNILIFLREKTWPNQENELECSHKRKECLSYGRGARSQHVRVLLCLCILRGKPDLFNPNKNTLLVLNRLKPQP